MLRISVDSSSGSGAAATAFVIILSVTVISACKIRENREPSSQIAGASTQSAPSWSELSNGAFTGLSGPAESVKLEGGSWQDTSLAGASRARIALVKGFYYTADLDGSPGEEAVTLLSENSGGSGEFLYLALSGRNAGSAVNLATTLLGDRIQIRSAATDSGRMLLDVVRPGPGDARCCPGELATLSITYAGGRLITSSGGAGRLTFGAISGVEWKLSGWDFDEPVGDSVSITLFFEESRGAGSSGCNRYFFAATSGSDPGDLTVGLSGATRMMCPPEIMNAEARYVKTLAAVKKFGFFLGKLTLTYQTDEGTGLLLFDRPM